MNSIDFIVDVFVAVALEFALWSAAAFWDWSLTTVIAGSVACVVLIISAAASVIYRELELARAALQQISRDIEKGR